MDPIAVVAKRGGVVESVHRASIAVTDARGRLTARFGDANRVTFLRSAAKIIQTIPVIESGAADRYGFTPRELAIITGSHSGEDDHVALVQGILDKIGADPSMLRCGKHAPFHKETAVRVGATFTTLHHNCSGKHAGMLAVCTHKGWDPATYLQPDHPLQQAIHECVAQETGVQAGSIGTAVDGCGVVTFAVPVRAGARAFARVGTPEGVKGERSATLRRIRDALVSNPHFVSGTDRVDGDLMRAAPGRLIVKAGAEACYGASLVGTGLGAMVKIDDGNPRAIGPALVRVLEDLGGIDAAAKRSVEKHWNDPILNVVGLPVGGFEAVFHLVSKRAPPKRLAATV